MDPQTERTPGLALPKPSSEWSRPAVESPQPGFASHEALLPSVETSPAPFGAPPIAALPQSSAIPAQPVPVAPAAPVTNPLAAAAPADDNTDSLDEEWINKAKAIVEQTKHDPRLESHELSRVKADYLRIRYNKHIKVTEEQDR